MATSSLQSEAGADGSQPPTLVDVEQVSTARFALRATVAILIAFVIGTIVAIAWLGARVLAAAFAGMLFGIFLHTLSDWVKRVTRLRHPYALTVVMVVLFALAGGIGWLIESRLQRQLKEMAQSLPESLEQLNDAIRSSPLGNFALNHTSIIGSAGVPDLREITVFIGTVADFGVALAVIFFVGLFGAATPEVYRSGLLMLVPPPRRERAAAVLDAVIFNLRWWLAGQVVLMCIVGTGVGIGARLLGIPLALTLGLMAGLFEIIPYVGAWLAAIPAILIAVLIGPWHVIMVLGMYLCVHLIEAYVVGPLIQRKVVHLPPALTVLTQLLLGVLLGLFGIFVAAPLTVTGVILIKMLYVQDALGDRAVTVPGERQAAG